MPINDELTSCIKEYIIDTYKHLIEDMHKMHPHEVYEESIDLREYIEVLNLKELKECYLWERKFKIALEAEINDSIYFLEYYQNLESEDKFSKEDKEFYELFTRDIEFEIAKKPILQKLSELRALLENNENLSDDKKGELELSLKETKIALQDLYEDYRKFYKDRPYNKWGLKARELLHDTLIAIMSTTLDFDILTEREDDNEIEFGNNKNILNAESYEEIEDEYFKKTLFGKDKGPFIYAANHTNVHDVPTICKAIEDHVYIIAGDEVRNDFNGLMFNLNGVDWVSRGNEKSRFLAKEATIRRTINELMYMYLPEGTWNMTESDPMLPFNWGIIDAAQKSGLPIVPVVLEYTEEVCYVKIAKPIYVSIFDDKLEAIDKLRYKMSTMRWYVWETLSMDMLTREQEEHKYLLEKLGMKFIPENRFLPWKEWIELLKSYKEYYGQLDMSYKFKTKDGINYDTEGYPLEEWLEAQKRELGRPNLSFIQELRKKELFELGIIINPVEEQYTWDMLYEYLKKYKEKNKDVNVHERVQWIIHSKDKDIIMYPLGKMVKQQLLELSGKICCPTKEEFYRDVIEASLKEYPKLDPKFESSVIFRPYTMNELAFSHLNNLTINKNNVWLLKDYLGVKISLSKEQQDNYYSYLEAEIKRSRTK